MRFVVGLALEMIRYEIGISPCFTTDDTENAFPTCRREVPGGSGEVRTGNDRLSVRGRGSPRHCMSREDLPPA
jgi:hypothetical protein